MRPGLRRPPGSKLSLIRRARVASAGSCGWKTSTAARSGSGARMRVACPRVRALRIRAAPVVKMPRGAKARCGDRPHDRSALGRRHRKSPESLLRAVEGLEVADALPGLSGGGPVQLCPGLPEL